MSNTAKEFQVRLLRVGGGQPAWSDKFVGEIFTVVTNGSKNWYYVVENGVVTNKLLSKRCTERI